MIKREFTIDKILNNDYYKKLFSKEILTIENIPKLPSCEFHHIGATSIDNSVGQKILDILVIVDNLHEITSFDEKRLNNINYHRIDNSIKGLVKYGKIIDYSSLKYEVILYIVQKDTDIFKNFLDFHSSITNNYNLRTKYNNEKSKIFSLYKNNYKLYNKEKEQYIKNILKKEHIYD